MKVYRIERKKYLKTTLEGIGASLSEGFRWNSLNTRLVYTAESRALATLEIAVHLDVSEDMPSDRYYAEIDIPDNLKILELREQDLPKGWDTKPPTVVSQYIGDDFVYQNAAAVLKVPSSIVPLSYNYLINPSHPDTGSIKVISTIPMDFDERIKRSEQ